MASGSQSSKESTQADELSFFRGRVMTARTHLSELQAKVDRIEAVLRSGTTSPPMLDSTDPTVSDELTNPTITRLRDKYLDYLAREKDMSAKYGSNHLAVINIRQQITALRTSMFDEIKRIAETYKSEYAIAKQHLDDLEKAFSAAVVDSELHDKRKGPLRELENSADSYRSLHDNLLQRYLQLVQEESSPTTEARFLTRASIPTPKSPFKAILIAGLTSMGGFAFGFGIGVFRQMTDRMFRTTDQVESALQIECISVVPMQTGIKKSISKSRLRTANNRGGIFNQQDIMWDTVKAPFSRYAEAIRAVKFAVDSNGDPMASKVIGVTSSIPNEGKSTIAGSLALLAADSGARTILVDCDLRNPRLSRRLAPNAEWGLLDVMTGGKPIEEVIITDPLTNLGFLPSVSGKRYTNEILSCEATRKLFEQLRSKYDYIVVDLSPIAPVVDVRCTTMFIDSYIFTVEWGSTKVEVVQHALKQAGDLYAKLIGVVLNKTPINSLGHYQRYLDDYYNSKSFKQYGKEAGTLFPMAIERK